jgi:hypothetical protein
MIAKCANYWCSASHQMVEVFPVDITIGGSVGEGRFKTVCLWLCDRCSREMSPKVEAAAYKPPCAPQPAIPAPELADVC